MTKIDSIKDTLKNNSAYRDNFIQALVEFEKRSGHPQVNVRDTVSGPLADELFMGEAFSKTLQNGLHINFVYNSKIAREFLLPALILATRQYQLPITSNQPAFAIRLSQTKTILILLLKMQGLTTSIISSSIILHFGKKKKKN